MSPEIRINRFLASAGLGSRRKVEQLVTGGEVYVNGEIIDDLAFTLDPARDEVTVHGKKVRPSEERLVLVLNKPAGILSSAGDDRGRRTVVDLAREKGFGQRLYPVGRLDMNTSGIILLTDDGDLSHRLTHPSFKVEKTYAVSVEGRIRDEDIEMIRNGIRLEDFTTLPCFVELVRRDDKKSLLVVRLKEGKKRQIRRMFLKLGHRVRELHRKAIGALEFADLGPGEIRILTEAEEQTLREQTGLFSKE